MTTKQKIILVIWFYVGWFGCVFFGKWQLGEWSLVFPGVAFILLIKDKAATKYQVIALFLSAIVGIVFDTLALRLGLISFPDPALAFVPLWLTSMWLLFSAMIPVSHALFKSNLLLAAILGAIFGPLSYYSGEAFEVFAFSSSKAILIFAIFWGVCFPAIHYIYRKLT